MLSGPVKQSFQVISPGGGFEKELFLTVGGVLYRGLRLLRWIRLLRHPSNLAPLAAGHAIQQVAGNVPTVKEVARFLFFTLSVLKCSEDIVELQRITRSIRGHFTGDEYLMVKRDKGFEPKQIDKWSPGINDRLLWLSVVGKERVKCVFRLIGEFFKKFAALVLHLSDAHAAIMEDSVSTMVVNASALWKKLTDDQSLLVRKLKGMEGKNDAILKILNSSLSTKIMLEVVLLPAKAAEKLPGPQDLLDAFKEGAKEKLMFVKAAWEKVRGLPPQERAYRVDKKGKDPLSLKIIKPPVRPAKAAKD